MLVAGSLLYLVLLFTVAFWAERRKGRFGQAGQAYVYALSMAVYCTAWTFYGSVGRAAHQGIEFLAVYLGPTLTIPLWWVVLRKIIRICKVSNISNLADFIAVRYGKSVALGRLVVGMVVLGIVPYIAIQFRAITNSYYVLRNGIRDTARPPSEHLWEDPALYMALVLAAFIIYFGTARANTAERSSGLVVAVAFESVIKLVAFLTVGVFVVFFASGGVGPIYKQIGAAAEWQHLFRLDPATGFSDWAVILLLSGLAFFLLPRQFQVAVVENADEKHLFTASWVFPLYLLLINLFVLPVAFYGNVLFAGQAVNPDTFVLDIPLSLGQDAISSIVYLGGFSAGTSMIIVETLALSLMMSNNLFMPAVARLASERDAMSRNISRISVRSRRASIVLVLLLSYLYYKAVGNHYSLVSIGLVSFAAVAQLAPALLGGIFWKKGTRQGAFCGLAAGFVLWFYTLVLPTLSGNGLFPASLLDEGPWGIALLRPQALLGIEGMSPLAQGVFWSLFANLGLYLGVSGYSRQSSQDRNQGELFVDIFNYSDSYESSVAWRGNAKIRDLRGLLVNFVGETRTLEILHDFTQRHQIDWQESPLADARLVALVEKELAGIIGAASARVMVANVVEEEAITLDEVLTILAESKAIIETNKALEEKSEALKRSTEDLQFANEQLKTKDLQKDEFLYTVTHEMRTPLTSIRGLSEILFDNPDLEPETQRQFLGTIISESERMSRLITQVLDLEKLESGEDKLFLARFDAAEMLHECISAMLPIFNEKGIQWQTDFGKNTLVRGDRDKLVQVFINLLSNAAKFCAPHNGRIAIAATVVKGKLVVSVADNGPGIEKGYQKLIFDKFYQKKSKSVPKPTGSGLGLAISLKIVQLHKGTLTVDSAPGQGATFTVTLPLA